MAGKRANYELLERLGAGAYAEVHRARNPEHTSNGIPEFVAIKSIDVSRVEGGMGSIEHEAMIMEMVGEHPHIATLYEEFELPASGLYCLVIELIAGGELFDRVAAKGAYAEDDASLILAELVDALTYLHGLGIVHRDVKPENICFATADAASPTRLIDFGYAAVLALDGSRERELGPSGYCGTARYLAPEQLVEGAPDTVAHDMWAAGVVLYILLSGFPPFTAPIPQLFDDIKAGVYDFPSPEWDRVSDDAKDLVRALLTVDPEKRMTAEQVARHQWVVTCGGALDGGLEA